jgi:hypothetical protein
MKERKHDDETPIPDDPDELVTWLQNKWVRHGEWEDLASARLIQSYVLKLDEETKRATGRSQGYVKLVERLAAAEKKAQDLDLANSAMHAIREACNEIMGGNCSYVDDDFARCLLTLRDKNKELESRLDALAKFDPSCEICCIKGCDQPTVWACPPLCESHTSLLEPVVERNTPAEDSDVSPGGYWRRIVPESE